MFGCSARKYKKMSKIKKKKTIYTHTQTTVKEEVSQHPTVVNKIILNQENIMCKYIDSPENTPANILSGGYDNNMITTLKYETNSETEESSSEDKNEIKCEYLEYGDETSDIESNASRYSIDIIQQTNNIDDESKFKLHEKIDEFPKHEDLFLIIVTDTKKNKRKNCSKTKVEKKKILRKCEICNKWYNTSYFSEHMKRLHGDKKQKAEAALISAMKRKLKSTKVNCQICQKTVSKVNYKAHFETHDPNKSKYICDVCGKTFAQKRLLVVHTVTHNTEFKFECKLCPYKGRSSSLLRIHMLKHKENMFTCETCKKEFYYKQTLKLHIELNHLGIRRYTCDICGAAFGYRRSLRQHQVKVHKNEKKVHGRIPSHLETKS